MKKAILLFTVVFIFLSATATGQLSGSYTINASLPAGGTNYQSFNAAVTSLINNGINGPVTFNVSAGIYAEQISIPAINGASVLNTITFQGLGSSTIITASPGAANLPVISLDSASHIVLANLKISITGTAGWGIHFMRQADTNTVDGCIIEGPALAGVYGIIGSGSTSAVNVVYNNAEYLTITNNIIDGCEGSIQFIGKSGPLTTPSRKINYGNNITIANNVMSNFMGKAVVVSYYHDVLVKSNDMYTNNSACNGAASFWDAGDNVIFTENKVYVNSDAANTRLLVYAMAPANGSAGESNLPGIIANNFLTYAGNNSGSPTAIMLRNKDNIKIYNNSIRLNNFGSNASCIWLDNSHTRSLNGIEIRNNILMFENAGSGQFIYSGSGTIGSRFKNIVIDHNNYYAPLAYFDISIPDGTGISSFNSFSAYLANTKGWGSGALNVDPQFVSISDLHATSSVMNDAGVVISGITHDIDGDLRSITAPDLGADEYSPPTCVLPTGLGVYNISGTAADFYWTQNNSGATVKVQYGPAGFVLGNGVKLTPTNDTITLSALTPQTIYDVYVMERCSSTDSSAWSSISFTTGCGVIQTYPYSEGFESSSWVSGTGTLNTGSLIDPCWTISPNGANDYSWGTRTGTTNSSNTGPTGGFGGSAKYIFTESSTGVAGDRADLISPSFDLSVLNTPELTFRYHMYGAAMGSMMIWAWNGQAYDTLMTISGDQGNSWEEAIIDLSAYKNTITHLVFHAVRGLTFTSDMAIDSVVIQQAPPCPKPTAITFDNLTTTSVRINFLSGGNKFNFEYGPTGFIQGTGTTGSVNGSGQNVNGLTPGVNYDFYLRNDCTDSLKGHSPWVGPITIRTLCAYLNNYYTNWDHLANQQSDYCWTFNSYSSTTAYARATDPVASASLQPYSGNLFYALHNAGASDHYLISPEITNLSTDNLQLRFQASDLYTGTAAIPQFYIGTMLSLNDTASFYAVDTITTTTNVWTEFTVPLNSIPANHKHVVIRNASNVTNVVMVMDDLYIEVQPLCAPPSFGIFSDVRDTSLVLSWTPGDGTIFDIEYGLSGFSQGSGINISGLTGHSDTITGLTANSCYEFYIRGYCGSNATSWYGPITMCTSCATLIAPFTENFEGAGWVTGTASTNAIEACWKRTPEATNTYRWQTHSGGTSSSNTGPSSGYGGSGKYLYTEASYGSNGALATLYMPNVNFSSLNAPTLSFTYHMFGAGINGLYVLLNDGAQIDTIWSVNGAQQNSSAAAWKTAYVDLTPYKSKIASIYYVGKRGSALTGDIAIDEVSIAEYPSCLLPGTFTLDSVYTTFADLSWTSLSNGTAFKLEYGPTGFSQGSNTQGVAYSSTNSTRLSGLTPNTAYDVYLADMCDSTNWVGPIKFTTIIQYDAALEAILSPFDHMCGDSSMTVQVRVKNNGLFPINTLTLGANISGSVNTSISQTFTNVIAPSATISIPLGTVNIYTGGVINIEVFANLANDQQRSNDTLSLSAIELISAVPLHHPIDSVCATDTSGMFIAIGQSGITHNWYANAQDVSPIATGDTIKVQPGQTLYLDRSQANSLVIQPGTAGSLFGSMFKIYVKQDFVFSGYTWVSHLSGTKSLKAFYRMGDYKGHETTRASWTLIDSLEMSGTTSLTPYRFNFRNPITFNAGDTISIYLASKTGKYEAQSIPGVSIGSVYKSTNDFDYLAGVGGAYFGANMIGATVASSIALTLHWESLQLCGNKRIGLTLGVYNDSAVASFTSVVNQNGADVDFDASASTGHVFDWDYGDGTTASGISPSHTYTAAGNYTVRLIVSDTICGTSDTISQVVMATVSLKDYASDNKLELYPNPNNGKFKVKFHIAGGQKVDLDLLSSNGQLIYTQALGVIGGHFNTELNVENLKPGIYLLRIRAGKQSNAVRMTVW